MLDIFAPYSHRQACERQRKESKDLLNYARSHEEMRRREVA